MNETSESGKPEINVEAIMQEIRLQILNQKRIGQPPLPVRGDRFSPEMYEQLYQATLLHGEMGVKLLVTRTEIPLIGGLIDRLRTKLHQLVLFYINQAVAQQAEINEHFLQVLALLIQDLEQGDEERKSGQSSDK
ncbi:MAG: hypothetical protein R3293_19860 [Candidatus Promineifilaceae bacterium]|nr:hypothetical protein [Candidatus Promineifilaceae bacterium]